MAYHGDDMDLRTPQTWSIPPADLAGPPEPYTNGGRIRSGVGYNRASPIFVDDIVLACCNHAFDVAVAHRAGEVRLEHLLHAMTRVDGTSNALEARGIRVAGLRRESATIIAGEIPIGLGAAERRPRRSDDFEQALRAASTIANRRSAPANVDDLLDAMLDMPSDSPGIALLARHGGRIARDRLPQRELIRDRDTFRDPARDWDQPLPPLSRPAPPYAESRQSEYRPAPMAYYASERASDRQPERGTRSDSPATIVDSVQNARIEQLESALRSLAAELSNDRKTDREDASRFRGGLHDRLHGLEQSLLSAAGNDTSATKLLDRLAAVERGLEQRLNELARPWNLLSDRLQALEQTILDTRGVKQGELNSLQDRIVTLDMAVTDRLKSVERKIEAAPVVDLTPLASRLDIIEEAVLNPVAADTRESEKLAERMRLLEETVSAHRAQVSQQGAQVGQQVGQANAALAEEMKSFAFALNNDVKGLASALSAQTASHERIHAFVSDRIQTLTSGFERQRTELTGPMLERIGGIASVVEGRFQTLAGLVDRNKTDVATLLDRQTTDVALVVNTRNSETQSALALMAERMSALETNLTVSLQKSAEEQAVHTAELKEVHEALIKLNLNQHTLAGSIDQWRLDGVGDISVIANRLDGIEKSTTRPLQLIENLTTSVDNINRATVERYHRRNRFWYWLFGTDDWVTASWPSQAAKIEAERAMLRGTAAAGTSVPKVAAVQQGAPQPIKRVV